MPIEPLSITVACTTLLSNVGKLSMEIYSFVSKVRDAHRDLDAVLKELSSLGLCLETLRNDGMVTSHRTPQPLEQRVLLVLVNAGEVIKDMREMLDNLSSDRFGNKMRWAFYGQNDMNKLRNRLESHKASLEIALALLSFTAIKEDTSSIRRNVKDAALGLDEIAAALAALPERIAVQMQAGAIAQSTILESVQLQSELPAAHAPAMLEAARTLENLLPPTTQLGYQSPDRPGVPAHDPEPKMQSANHEGSPNQVESPRAENVTVPNIGELIFKTNAAGGTDTLLQTIEGPRDLTKWDSRSPMSENFGLPLSQIPRPYNPESADSSDNSDRIPNTQGYRPRHHSDSSRSPDRLAPKVVRFQERKVPADLLIGQDGVSLDKPKPEIATPGDKEAMVKFSRGEDPPSPDRLALQVEVIRQKERLGDFPRRTAPQSASNTDNQSSSKDNGKSTIVAKQTLGLTRKIKASESRNSPAVEIEERRRQDMLRASAAAMAKKMFAVQQAQIDEAKGIHRSQGQYAAHTAGRRAQLDATNQPAPVADPPRYENLEDAARRLAQERLSKIHDEHAEYQQYYNGKIFPQRSRMSLRRGRQREQSEEDSDSNVEESRKIGQQMSLFQSKLAEIDSKKRPDRGPLAPAIPAQKTDASL